MAGLTVAGVLAVAVTAHDSGPSIGFSWRWRCWLSSFEAVTPLPGAARELSATLEAGRRVLELTCRQPAVRDPVAPLPAPPPAAAVALEGVTARYAAGERLALERFDLRLDPGRRVALVGPSGAGKTTVANLLFRFLDPEDGVVTIAGRDARAYRQEDVRGTFALAGQDAHLFNTTIRQNLRVGRPSATDADLLQALRRARIDEWVSACPKGSTRGSARWETRFPGASTSASCWLVRCSRIARCWCSTSPPPTSTRRRQSGSWMTCWTRRRARPSC